MLVKTSEAGNTLSSFARGKLQKRENIEGKREVGNDDRRREVSSQNGRVGISVMLKRNVSYIWVNLATINFSIVLTRNQYNAWT